MAVMVDQEKCTGCGICADECPAEAIRIENDKAVISEECTDCGTCVDECPDKALAMEE